MSFLTLVFRPSLDLRKNWKRCQRPIPPRWFGICFGLFVRDKSIHQPKALEIYCVSRLAMKAKLETGRTKSEGEERLVLGGMEGRKQT